MNLANWIQGIGRRWSDWTGDRDMECKIRDELNRLGYSGERARLSNVRLVAIQRPGWVQIYTFACSLPKVENAEDCPVFTSLFGVARMDERHSDSICVFPSSSERDAVTRELAKGLILDRRLRRSMD